MIIIEDAPYAVCIIQKKYRDVLVVKTSQGQNRTTL